ncbi:MAG: hypothetical protein AB8H12_08615 [Lewinella sp.]
MRYLFLICGALFFASCTPRVYEATGLESIAEKHTTIAIIQPKVHYKFERPDHKNWALVPDKKTISNGIQLALADWVEARRKQGVLDIRVLDIDTANAQLAAAGVTEYAEMASALGVDAVLASRLNYDARMDYVPGRLYLADELPQSRIYLNLFTADEGLIWSYENGGTHFNGKYDRMVFDLLRNAAERMPYAVAK